MPRRMLTDRFCSNARSEGSAQTDYFDETVPGLALRVSTKRKSWTYHFTWNNRRSRLTFGTYPATSLASARTRAFEAKVQLEAGNDPRAIKKDTLKAVCEAFLAREGGNLRTAQERLAIFERVVFPELGGKPIDAIRRSDVVRLLDKIADERGPSSADHALAYLRRVFTWHASRTDDFHSPIVRGMARTKPKERARERTLTDEEIRIVWKVAETGGIFGHFLRFVLLTAGRRNEAADMRWDELNGSNWTLPGSRNKTKVDLVRPLSEAALAALPDQVGPFVFSTDGKNPISGFSKFKRHFDKLAERTAGGAMLNWTIHDLRRTARSLMSRAGVPSDHAERCLGHVIAGVRGTYDRHDFYEEKAQAFEALAGTIDRILNPRDNVVPMKADTNG